MKPTILTLIFSTLLLVLLTTLTSALPFPIPYTSTNSTTTGLFPYWRLDCGSLGANLACKTGPMFWSCDPNTGAPSKQSKMQYCDDRCRCVPHCSDLIYVGVDSPCIGADIAGGIGGVSGRDDVDDKEIRAAGEEDAVEGRATEDDDTVELELRNDDDTVNIDTKANDTATPDTLQPATNASSHGLFKVFQLDCGNAYLNDVCPKPPETYACDATTGKPTYVRKDYICQKYCRCVDVCAWVTPAAFAPPACVGGGIGINSGTGGIRRAEGENEV